MDKTRHERWISGSRYLSEKIIVRCLNCGETNLVTAESEFGATIWLPEECPDCKHSWENNKPWEIEEI